MMMVITSLIVSPLSRWRCFLPSLNRGCWAFNSGKVPWQNSSQSTKSCTMSISVLLFVVGTSGANLSRFLPKKESRDSTTELISLLCFNFYIELTLISGDGFEQVVPLTPSAFALPTVSAGVGLVHNDKFGAGAPELVAPPV